MSECGWRSGIKVLMIEISTEGNQGSFTLKVHQPTVKNFPTNNDKVEWLIQSWNLGQNQTSQVFPQLRTFAAEIYCSDVDDKPDHKGLLKVESIFFNVFMNVYKLFPKEDYWNQRDIQTRYCLWLMKAFQQYREAKGFDLMDREGYENFVRFVVWDYPCNIKLEDLDIPSI